MLKQIILGTREESVKYHGRVKFLVFQCNFCRREFSKMESYARKQVKIHRNACCFCSPACRVQYFKNKSKEKVVSQVIVSDVYSKTETSVFGWIKDMLKK